MKRSWFAARAFACAAIVVVAAHAQTPQTAGQHFDRGVALYNETDYRGALVEFKRAYEASPNPAVLFNIGQSEFQLKSYGEALVALQKYLAEAPPNASHRAEAEQSVETLKSRVGKLDVTTNPPGAEVFVDDESIGRPGSPVLIGVGRHKVSAAKDGQPPVVRTIELAAGETVTLKIDLETASAPPPVVTAAPVQSAAAPVIAPPPPEVHKSAWMPIAWVGTAVFAAAGITTGVVALHRGSQLDSARNDGPSTHAQLDSLHTSMRGYALASDILDGAAIVTGAVAIYLTLAPATPTSGAITLRPTARGALLGGSF